MGGGDAGSSATSSMSDEERIEKMSGAVKTILEVGSRAQVPSLSFVFSVLVLTVWCVLRRVRCVNGARAGPRRISVPIIPHTTVKWLGPRPTSRCLATAYTALLASAPRHKCSY